MAGFLVNNLEDGTAYMEVTPTHDLTVVTLHEDEQAALDAIESPKMHQMIEELRAEQRLQREAKLDEQYPHRKYNPVKLLAWAFGDSLLHIGRNR
jgi:hypothetical protein